MIRGRAFRFLVTGVVAAVAFVAVIPSVQADPHEGDRVAGAIVGSVIGGVIGSAIGDGRGRGLAIGVGSMLGGIAGYHAVEPDPYPRHRRGHRHLRHRWHAHYDSPRPRVHVHPRHPRRERHVHHHYHEAPPRPRTVVTYRLPAPVAPAAVREVNVVIAPPSARSSPRHQAALTECKLLEAGIAPVYACRTAGGDWRVLR